MAPVEDNDSGMESQDGSQSVDQEQEEPITEIPGRAKKQPEIENGDDDEVDPLRFSANHVEILISATVKLLPIT